MPSFRWRQAVPLCAAAAGVLNDIGQFYALGALHHSDHFGFLVGAVCLGLGGRLPGAAHFIRGLAFLVLRGPLAGNRRSPTISNRVHLSPLLPLHRSPPAPVPTDVH